MHSSVFNGAKISPLEYLNVLTLLPTVYGVLYSQFLVFVLLPVVTRIESPLVVR